MTASPIIVSQRAKERDYLLALNERFQNYVGRVRTMREQSKNIENNTFIAHTQALENELFEVKAIYEKELDSTRKQLDQMTSERNSYQLEASKNGALANELQDKHNNEQTTRKKLENALADAHRLLSEKDSLIQELRITIAQHQNAHLDTTKERDQLQTTLNNVQTLCDSESKARADLEASVQKLSDQLQFERQLHDKALMELNNKLSAAERAIAIADEKLREHDIVDDNLANTIAKMRMQTQAEFRRFQDESEAAYQASLVSMKVQLENESKSLAAAYEENIHLKAIIEEMNAKIGKLDSRCAAVEDQNRSLIHTLEVERQQAQNTIKELEEKLREMQEHLNSKIRELNIAYNAQIPLDLEIEAFANLLDAEEKRLSVALANPPSELVQTARGDLVSSRSHYTGVRSLPSSPRKPVSGIVASPTPISARAKSVPVNEETKELPPLSRADSPGKPSSPGYYLPGIGDSSSRIFKNPRGSYGTTATPTTRIYYRK